MTSPVTATSRDALHDAISNGRAAVVTDAIYRVVQKAHREGIKDMSMQEIKAALRADAITHGRFLALTRPLRPTIDTPPQAEEATT